MIRKKIASFDKRVVLGRFYLSKMAVKFKSKWKSKFPKIHASFLPFSDRFILGTQLFFRINQVTVDENNGF